MQICSSPQTDNHTRIPPLRFLQAECPSWQPTNSVKALMHNQGHDIYLQFHPQMTFTAFIVWFRWWKVTLWPCLPIPKNRNWGTAPSLMSVESGFCLFILTQTDKQHRCWPPYHADTPWLTWLILDYQCDKMKQNSTIPTSPVANIKSSQNVGKILTKDSVWW